MLHEFPFAVLVLHEILPEGAHGVMRLSVCLAKHACRRYTKFPRRMTTQQKAYLSHSNASSITCRRQTSLSVSRTVSSSALLIPNHPPPRYDGVDKVLWMEVAGFLPAA